ncbi:MAG: sugar transferase [Planctomycetota bacterium]|nr:sugar transferase [Planctomycetota bacterium]
MKRLFDVVVSASVLILLSPLLLLVGIVVRSTSPGKAIFRQTRIGRHGRPFTLLKFRSMTTVTGAEDGSFDAGDRSRVTSVGRLLRRSKVDELPQLWNVLVGDMSLVGPRPEVRRWTEAHPDRWKKVLSVRPGLTDPASLEFRHEEDLLSASDDPETLYRDVILPRKLELSERYVRDRSFVRDLSILIRTFLAVIPCGTGSPGSESRESAP